MQHGAVRVEHVTVRLSEEELDLIEKLTTLEEGSRSDIIRRLIRGGAREELIRIALERYQAGEVGMRGAAAIAGLSIGELLQEANERNILSNYDEADLDDDVDSFT